jgi:DDE superfamily endonuclease
MSSIANAEARGERRTARRRAKQRRQLRARAARRKLQAAWKQVPSRTRPLLEALAGAFTRPTFLRFAVLLLAAILTAGNRTILNLLRTLGALAPGHPSSYHRVFSHRRWSSWRLAHVLAGWVVRHWLPQGRIPLAGDDTTDEHRGKKVYGKGCHRDAVRSTHSYTTFRWGHKWVVLALLVRFPFARRPWALPVLVALYRPPAESQKSGRRHKTPAQLLRQLACVLLRWFPRREFLLAGDQNFGTHELARLARRQRRFHLVSRFYADANLYEPPPVVTGKRKAGRPRKKGARLPTPEQVVQQRQRRRRLNVAWYGCGRRDVAVVTGVGHWYKAGHGLVAVRWVFVHDRTGTHRDEYFFTTDVTLSAQQVIEAFTGRWSLETTFQEMRSYLGLETTRGWSERTVLRVAPCLLGLYTVVVLLYVQLPARYRRRLIDWPGKKDLTFSDAISAVRRWLWVEWVFAIPGHRQPFAKLPRTFRAVLLYALAPAA